MNNDKRPYLRPSATRRPTADLRVEPKSGRFADLKAQNIPLRFNTAYSQPTSRRFWSWVMRPFGKGS